MHTGSVIYYLTGSTGEVFYVGQTCRLQARLRRHRQVYGAHIRYKILQDSFEPGESAIDAEKRWIATFLDAGCQLRNIVSNPNARKRALTAEMELKRSIIWFIDNYSKIKALATRRGLTVRECITKAMTRYANTGGQDDDDDNIRFRGKMLTEEECRQLYSELAKAFYAQRKAHLTN